MKTRVGSDGSRQPYGTERQKLVHCNWGWDGSHNGYYISGVFDLNKGATVLEEDETSSSSVRNYDSDYCRIITYSKP